MNAAVEVNENNMTFLIFDTETCGLPRSRNVDPTEDFDNWPRMVQLAWQLHDQTGALLHCDSLTVKPVDFEIPLSATKIHGIAHEDALAQGIPIADVLKSFVEQLKKADFMVGHNLEFDLNILKAEFLRGQLEIKPLDRPAIDTMKDTLDQKQPPGKGTGKPKFKKLEELYEDLFGEPTVRAHDAGGDVHSTARAFFESVKRGLLDVPASIDTDRIRYEAPDLSALRRDEPTAPRPASPTGERG